MRRNLTHQVRTTGSGRLLDDARYKSKFEVVSESSGRVYRISYDSAPGAGYWVCSCPGYLTRGKCKHLSAAGLRGRAEKRSGVAASPPRPAATAVSIPALGTGRRILA